MAPPHLIHIGLPKAGSTSFQRWFSQLPDISYLGKRGGKYVDPRIEYFIRTVVPHAETSALDRALHEIKPVFAALESDGRRQVLSDEILSGIGFGSLGRGTPAIGNVLKLPGLFERPITFIVVVRNQWDLLRSYHHQLCMHGARFDFSHFLCLVLARSDQWLLPTLDYPRLAEGFSGHTLAPICIEEWKTSPMYRERICAALELPSAAQTFPEENVGAGKVSTKALLEINDETAFGYGAPFGFELMSTDLHQLENQAARFGVEGTLQQFIRNVGKLSVNRRECLRAAAASDENERSPWDDVPDDLRTEIRQLIRRLNTNIHLLDSSVDWTAHGYLS